MTEEWGPWIEHDGSGCPVPGQYVQTEGADGKVLEHIAHQSFEGPSYGVEVDLWDWSHPILRVFVWRERIIRYRIRKPRGMVILEDAMRELETEDAT